MRPWLLPLVTISLLWPGAAARQSTFQDLFARYRGTNADAAIREFATWSSSRYEADANLTAAQRADPWTAAALALFYLETDLRRLAIGKGTDSTQSDFKPFEVGVSLVLRAQRLLDEAVLPTISPSRDWGLAAFCRDWLIVRETVWQGIVGERSQVSWRDLAEQYFFDDPKMATTMGIQWVSSMGPFADGDSRMARGEGPAVKGGAYDRWASRVITVGKHTYYAENARNAELAFRRALAGDPSIVEARLRLGRLYQVIGRTKEADAELTRAEREAAKAGDRVTGYLASLFLGALHEDAGRAADAETAYRSALATYPAGMAARFALGDALLTWGRADEGWDTIRSALGADTRTALRDPWAVYQTFGYWQFGALLSAMRQKVSQTPLGTVTAGLERTLLASSPAMVEPVVSVAAAPMFKSGIEGVRVDTVVMDGDRPVQGLTTSDFVITDNGAYQRVTESTIAGKLAVSLVLDASSSLNSADGVALLKRATDAAERALADTDRVAVVTAADRVHLLSDLAPKGEPLRAAIAGSHPRVDDFTALWDAVLAGSSLVVNAPGRPIVLVISDGPDNVSWFPRDRTLDRLNRRGLMVDGIKIPPYLDRRLWDFAYGDINLREPALATGGVAFDVNDRDLDRKVAARFTALRQSYILMYTPENAPAQKDGWHEIKVSLRPGQKGKVQARPGYYAAVKK